MTFLVFNLEFFYPKWAFAQFRTGVKHFRNCRLALMRQGYPLKHELIFSAMAGPAGDRFSISPSTRILSRFFWFQALNIEPSRNKQQLDGQTA
ncbi:hypothetical protein C2E25_08230 [Geothermobacter hydrogeniphilus]|uniref:Uncharacterized protein n=1 Tax=Geothermobacter hydrogeniphilus TaxID=1969733 RepID=A0A2K2HAM9_9BACT|nr:hypothetical protein C2E25_08230 [Geothermobacter hydrogeniphilus]